VQSLHSINSNSKRRRCHVTLLQTDVHWTVTLQDFTPIECLVVESEQAYACTDFQPMLLAYVF
jgi:hypothetical protein